MEIGKLISFARDLVRMPSLSGDERKVAQRVELEMKSLNFDSVSVDEAGNIIGIITGKQPGSTIVYDAHMDTVGIAPGAPWKLDPFSGEIMDGALHGRGAADMKGALAAMVYAAASLDRNKLAGKVVISASVLEEVLEGVALEKVVAQTGADFVVIGEATGLNLARGGRGRAEVHLETVGKPSHSSAPQQGRNAVLDMMRVIAAIEALALPEDSLMGPAIFALTDIISDPYPGHSVIPSLCRVTYDRRLLPGERADGVLRSIVERRELSDIKLNATIGIGKYNSYNSYTFVQEKFFPAWLLPEDEPYVQKSLSALHGIGLNASPSAYRFCTNAAWSAGIAAIPTVGFGPGLESDAHIVDEKLKIEDLIAAAQGYKAIAEAMLS
ncbi:MAG: YgeY family selenium metabolism-linked hydrolase [Caldilineaceae bacterium]|nr:YgeY family selenium metabolism-linked hydrolase [Caldilineaceae bacterium]